MRNAGKVLSKTMILSHVWGYSFDPEHQRRRRARLAPARQDRPAVRDEAAAHRPRRRLRAPRIACGGTIGLRLSLWYSAVFVGSTVLLVGLTYALLASSLAQRDHDIITATLREYASRYIVGGLPALERAVELEQRTGSRERLFVRVLGPDADAVFASVPPGFGDFDISQLQERSRRPGRAPGAGSRCRAGGGVGAVARTAPSSRSGRATKSGSRSCGSSGRSSGGWRCCRSSSASLGGLVLTRSTLRPVYELIDVVRNIIRTGRTDERVPSARQAAMRSTS